MPPYKSTEMALERIVNHIEVTHLPSLFQLPKWENVNRSTSLINST